MSKHVCDYIVMLNTTSPLIRLNTLKSFLDVVKTNQYDTILSVVSEKAEVFFKREPLNFSFNEKINSQLLEPVEKLVWSITAWKRNTFMTLQENGQNPVYGGNIFRFEIPKDESCDLDTQEDWNIAEGILKARQINEKEKYLSL